MPKETYTFKGKAYISGSRQDASRCDVVSFQFDASQKIEVAKLNLLGTDLQSYQPVLLDVTVKISLIQGLKNARPKKRAQTIR